MRKRIYLLCPYSHTDKRIIEVRVNAANFVAGKIMKMGHFVFSPISHSHPIAETMDGVDNCDHNFWLAQDLPVLADMIDEAWVLMLQDWWLSFGIHIELINAKELDIPVRFLDPMDWGVRHEKHIL